ncbi:dipeptidase [Thermohalobacter berrensis]|uniref:Peptidase M19 n=1 Tax=Thermohalobacter berrensis TaxID=99594 RepID=A0A419T3E2_9FIRM|nr:dipeptidase [Thermohalobacter berrensis]RKD31946.1 peptidase M19 [Thermohalobacter berrensis]
MIFDAHADIWTDVAIKRQKGQNNIIKKYHINKFKKGNIKGGIFVIWVDPPHDKEPRKRTLEIIKNMAVEIVNNQDILKVVREYSDLKRAEDEEKLGVIIGIEGLSGIGKDVDLIDTLYLLGLRHASLTWNEENELATGVSGNPNRGLTKYGVNAVKRLEKLGMLVDVSHGNEKTFWDICEVTTKPIIASHSNCKALCNVPRNLTDKQLKAIAEKDGVVGINAFREFVHTNEDKQNIEYLANHIDHMVEVMGIDHVGFGFDFFEYLEEDTVSSFTKGGGVGAKGIENITKVGELLSILESRGYSKNDLDKIKYINFYKIIKEILK